jgi:hypothetical protein
MKPSCCIVFSDFGGNQGKRNFELHAILRKKKKRKKEKDQRDCRDIKDIRVKKIIGWQKPTLFHSSTFWSLWSLQSFMSFSYLSIPAVL